MKILVLVDMKQLTESIIGYAFITQNPYKILSENSFSAVQLYTCENEVPEGKGRVRIQNGKVYTPDGKMYGCDAITDLHTIVFEPDHNYPNLGVGSAKEMSLLSMHEDKAGESAVILVSEEAGPSTWTQCVYIGEDLDFGGQKVIQAVALQ